MPAKPLTPEQKEDARRLEAAFAQFQDRMRDQGRPTTQDVTAEALGMGQSALSQYLKGRIPLNARTLLAFCELMGEHPANISPTIAAAEMELASRWIRLDSGRSSRPALSAELLAAIERSSEATKLLVENQARLAVGLPTLSQRDSLMSGTDAAATFDVPTPPDLGDVQIDTSLDQGSDVDLDQDLAAGLTTLARQLQTMPLTQRQAMVAKLRTLGRTPSWGETRARELGEETIDQDAPATSPARKKSR